MPDEVLTNLCSVCHAEPHKYKCPGCGARTCSLPCIKKHKSRTECSGRHNPTAFVPIEKLRTPAGIDHDYNFISAIDRAKQRAQRDIVEELGLLREDELHPKDEDGAFYKVWKGDQLLHIPNKHQDRRRERQPGDRDRFDKAVRRRLRALDIDARPMPKGMTRQKENLTTFNRKTKWINWQIELFVYGAPGLDEQPTRILHRALDGKPLFEVLAASIKWKHGNLDWERRNQEQQKAAQEAGRFAELAEKPTQQNANKKRKRAKLYRQPTQDPKTSVWSANNLLLQDTATGEWNKVSDKGAASVPPSEAEEAASYTTWHIYLHQPFHPGAGGRKALISLSSRDTLAEVLRGMTIVEFPTLYVFPPRTEGLPEGFIQVPGERRTDETESSDSDSNSDSDSDSSSSSDES
ncbi:Box C/D snoRNA protein 1, partial [Rhypophila decipiens]